MVCGRLLMFAALVSLATWPRFAVGQEETPEILGTWRWVDTVGDLLPMHGTPSSCSCARILVLKPDSTYSYFSPDSSGGFLLAEGRFSTRSEADVGAEPIGRLRLSFTPTFDSRRHSFPRDQMVHLLRGDTIVIAARATANPPSDLSRRFVREPAFTGKVPPPRTNPPKARAPMEAAKDSLTILPPSTTPGPYEDPAIPVTTPELTTARWMKGRILGGDFVAEALVATDGRVKAVKVVDVDADESVAAAVKRWVFKPSLMSGRPVATWVEIPFQNSE